MMLLEILCERRTLIHDDDMSVCAQNIFLAPIATAVVLVVAWLRSCKQLPSEEQETLQYSALVISDDGSEDCAKPQAASAERSRSSSRYAFWLLCVAVASLYAIACVPNALAAVSGISGLRVPLFGDACHLIAWLVALSVLRNSGPSVGIGLRLWTVLELLVCTLHLRTDVLALMHNRGEESPEGATTTCVRVAAALATSAATVVAATMRARPSSTSFDPLSVITSSNGDATAAIAAEFRPIPLDVPPEQRLSEEDGASLWQWLMLGWLSPLLQAGLKSPLQDGMLYSLPPVDSPDANAALIRENWERMLLERQKEYGGAEPSIWRLLWRMYGRTFVVSGCMMIASVSFEFAPQLVLNALLSYIEGSSSHHSVQYGYTLALLMFVIPALGSLASTHSQTLLLRLGVRCRAALTSLVYYKSLRLSQKARVQFSDGYIMNLMQIDANRLSNNAGNMHRTWTIPLKFIACVSLLFFLIGPAAFAGVLVMLILAPGNYYAMKAMLKFTRSIQTKRDTRVKLLGETLSGMKVVKLLGWEKQLRSHIEAARVDELSEIASFRYLGVAVEFLVRLSPLLLKALGFGMYVFLEDELTASKAFTALGLFDILVGPVSNFPKVIQICMELRVSVERLLSYMVSEESEVQYSLEHYSSSTRTASYHKHTEDEEEDEPSEENDCISAIEGVGSGGYVRLPGMKTIPETSEVVLEMSAGTFRWSEGKVAKEDEKERKLAEKKEAAKTLEAARQDGKVVAACEERIRALDEVIQLLQDKIDECGESPLLPASGPPTLSAVNLAFTKGSISCVVGPVGCGKSTLLCAALNEVPLESGRVVLAGKVAYCSQEPFLLHASLRDNILFGEPFDQGRYKLALEACALITDIQQLSGDEGDETEIGEKGLNLSGGQKAGVSLARAVYANADVYLIDDVLAAVDVAVAETMMEKCILGALANKTRIIVTHRAARWFDQMDQIVLMQGGDGTGCVVDTGTHAELLDRGHVLPGGHGDSDEYARNATVSEQPMVRTISDAAEIAGPVALSRTLSNFGPSVLEKRSRGEADDDDARAANCEEQLERPDRQDDWASSGSMVAMESSLRGGVGIEMGTASSSSNKQSERQAGTQGGLTKAEDRATGAVAAGIWVLYFRLIGLEYCPAIFGLLVVYQAAQAGAVGWMACWTAQIEKNGTEDTAFYFWVWVGLLSAYTLIASLVTLIWVNRSIAAGQQMHDTALWRLLRAPMSYFDTTKAGRIINRFSNDLQKVDMELQGNIKMLTVTLVRGAMSLGILVCSAPYILVVLVPISIAYLRIMHVYRCSARELQRLSSAGASPIYSMFGETLTGVQTTRAYDRNSQLQWQNQELLGALMRPTYLKSMVQMWLNLRLQLMGATISSIAAAIAVFEYGGTHRDEGKAGFVGFVLVNAMTVMAVLNGFIQTFTSTENCLVAMERLNALASDTPQEAALEVPEVDPAQGVKWPQQGSIEFQDVWMAYRPDMEPALKGVSFRVEPGEKVGIVGRRGAGKSSILLTLFRLVEPLTEVPSSGDRGLEEAGRAGGTIRIDGLDVCTMGLGTLRGGLSIIPQDPVLFSGTLKSNLDPAGTKSDAQLWDAIEEVGLRSFVEGRHGKLEMTVDAKGENLACGQRQLFCLARALLIGSRILVLDEATANVDRESDDLIQRRLRELQGVTMLTIAHRLDTIIDYDKVIVLSDGIVKECDNPRVLAQTEGSLFAEMWTQYNAHT